MSRQCCQGREGDITMAKLGHSASLSGSFEILSNVVVDADQQLIFMVISTHFIIVTVVIVTSRYIFFYFFLVHPHHCHLQTKYRQNHHCHHYHFFFVTTNTIKTVNMLMTCACFGVCAKTDSRAGKILPSLPPSSQRSEWRHGGSRVPRGTRLPP